jgi:hypothetical protein
VSAERTIRFGEEGILTHIFRRKNMARSRGMTGVEFS